MSCIHKYTHILIKYTFKFYKDVALCNLTKSTHLWNQHPDQETDYFSLPYIFWIMLTQTICLGLPSNTFGT